MDNVIDQLITASSGLFLLAGGYLLWFITGIANYSFNTRKWSWKKTVTDLAKAFLMAFVILALVALSNGLDWYSSKLGFNITEFTDGVSTTTLFGGIVAGIALYYGRAVRNALNFFKLPTNVKPIEGSTQDYAGIANDVKSFVETITTKTDEEHLKEADAPKEVFEDVKISEEDAGKGGVNNTYPEPYRSAVQDSLIDPSTCYNREAQPAGTMITMEDGSYKAVEDIKVGNTLWNHKGEEIVTVKSLWKEKKPVYTIRTGMGVVRFTGEHPLYARKNRWKVLPRGAVKAYGKAEFIKTKDIKVGDKIYVPQIEGEELPLTPNELRWLGFYLGDGTKASKSDKCPIYRLCVADGRKREFVDSLGINGAYSVHSNSDRVKFFTLSKKAHPSLRMVLDSFNDKSFNKLVTSEQAKYIVEGYLEADGHKFAKDIYSVSSTDKKLLLAIQRMVISMGGTMSFHKRYEAGRMEKFGTTVNAKTFYEGNVNLSPKRTSIHEFDDGKFVTVTDVKYSDELEDVYNIEVSGTHTYIAENLGVHNCVSYVAWKIAELTGNWPRRTGGMNARDWVQRLAENGYTTVVSKPANGGKYVGVSESGPYGHVVWFEDGETISEYNYSIRGGFSVRMINLSAYKWVQIKAPATQTATQKKEAEKAEKAKTTTNKKDGTVTYTYRKGDTFGQVLLDLGLSDSAHLWGDNGDVAYYTNQLHEQGIWGNIPIGQVIRLTPR